MASTFLERNRQQAVVKAAEPASRWKRGIGPLSAVMAVGMGFLMIPTGVVTSTLESAAGLPVVGDWVAQAAGVTKRSKGGGYAELMAALKAARQEGGKSPWGLLSRSGRGDSLGMVRGSESEVLGAAKIAAKLNGNGGTTINGVLSPNEARRAGKGVQLTREDVLGETSASTYSGRGGVKVYAGRGLLTGGRLAPAQEEDSARNPTRGAKAPDAAKNRAVADKEPKMTKTEFRTAVSNSESVDAGVQIGGPGSALAALADARTSGQRARAPNCTSDNGCTPEFANSSSAAVYDHNAVGKKNGGTQSAPAVTGVDGISTPSAILADGEGDYVAEVEKIRHQQKSCLEADARFKPLLDPHNRRISEIAALPPTPQSKAELRNECLIIDELMRQQYQACPLRHEEGAYVPQKCD